MKLSIFVVLVLLQELLLLRARHVEEGEPTRNAKHIRGSSRRNNYNYDSYLTFEQIKDRILFLEKRHADLARVSIAGSSVEGRDIYLVTIPGAASASNNKPIIFIDGGIHAREWVSPAAALYAIDRLLESPSLTQDVEWRIMPLVNPDGYAFSHSSPSNRMWRKNRAKTHDANCPGVDLNRNFDVFWNETNQDPCSQTYSGTGPFSEPESRAVRDAVRKVRRRLQAYITLHTYGQLFLYPFGYTRKQPKEKDLKRLKAMGKGMAKAVYAKYQNKYIVDQASSLGAAAGGSDDWAFLKMRVPYSYTFELQDKVDRPYRFTVRGFQLSPHKLLTAVSECWEALKYLGQEIQSQKSQTRITEEGKPDEDHYNTETSQQPEEGMQKVEQPPPAISEVQGLTRTKPKLYPKGWPQLIEQAKKVQAEVRSSEKDNPAQGCSRVGNLFVCPHLIFWGSMYSEYARS